MRLTLNTIKLLVLIRSLLINQVVMLFSSIGWVDLVPDLIVLKTFKVDMPEIEIVITDNELMNFIYIK